MIGFTAASTNGELEPCRGPSGRPSDMRRFLALFDGMPEGLTLLECALDRAERGEPLAVELLAIWNAGAAA